MNGIVMASLTPISDLELLNGEYAAIRPATAEERRTLGHRRRAVVYAIVLRSCAGITAIVVEAKLARSTIKAGILDSMILFLSRNNESGKVISKGAAVIAMAQRMFPSLEATLRQERPTAGPCTGCNCLWRADGAFDLKSRERGVLQAIASAEPERAAA